MGNPLRRVIIALAVLGLTVLNPLHLPFSLPWLTEQYAGTSLGDFLRDNEGAIIVAGTVYFTAAMIPVYYWIWRRTSRRRPDAGASARVAASVAVREPISDPESDGYQGPGGGKRSPRPSRSRRRRTRARQ